MSERDADFFPASGSPPAPDASRSTAEFRAFASRTGETEPPWRMKAPGRNVAVLAAVVIGVAVVLAVIAIAVASG
jgi:hypothetical protein